MYPPVLDRYTFLRPLVARYDLVEVQTQDRHGLRGERLGVKGRPLDLSTPVDRGVRTMRRGVGPRTRQNRFPERIGPEYQETQRFNVVVVILRRSSFPHLGSLNRSGSVLG